MAEKTHMFRGLRTGVHGARRNVTRRSLKGKRTHKQKWTGIAGGELAVAVVGFVLFAVFDGTWLLVGSFVMTALAAFGFAQSRSTPPDARHTVQNPQRDKLKPTKRETADDARVTHGTITVTPWDRVLSWYRGGMGGDRRRNLRGRRPCGAACQYSYAPVEQCECSCGGRLHGMKAPVIIRKRRVKPKAAATKKVSVRKAPVRKTSPRKPTTKKLRP